MRPTHQNRGCWRKNITIIVISTLLGEMHLPLYLRGDGEDIGDQKKERAIGERLEQQNCLIFPNTIVL